MPLRVQYLWTSLVVLSTCWGCGPYPQRRRLSMTIWLEQLSHGKTDAIQILRCMVFLILSRDFTGIRKMSQMIRKINVNFWILEHQIIINSKLSISPLSSYYHMVAGGRVENPLSQHDKAMGSVLPPARPCLWTLLFIPSI